MTPTREDVETTDGALDMDAPWKGCAFECSRSECPSWRAQQEIGRLREALTKARGYLRPPPGSHYPHGVTYAVQAIDAALAAEARDE